jgi:hypothetical protein
MDVTGFQSKTGHKVKYYLTCRVPEQKEHPSKDVTGQRFQGPCRPKQKMSHVEASASSLGSSSHDEFLARRHFDKRARVKPTMLPKLTSSLDVPWCCQAPWHPPRTTSTNSVPAQLSKL